MHRLVKDVMVLVPTGGNTRRGGGKASRSGCLLLQLS